MINYFVPIIVIIVLVYGFYKGVDIFSFFLEGVKDGLEVILNIFPTIFAMVFSINILIDSNIIMDISNFIRPLFKSSVFPVDALPLMILKPISGSSSLAVLANILKNYGPDSFIGRVSSVIQGSTDTTIYIISLYFSSVGIKKIRYSLVVGLIADIVSIILSIVMVLLLF